MSELVQHSSIFYLSKRQLLIRRCRAKGVARQRITAGDRPETLGEVSPFAPFFALLPYDSKSKRIGQQNEGGSILPVTSRCLAGWRRANTRSPLMRPLHELVRPQRSHGITSRYLSNIPPEESVLGRTSTRTRTPVRHHFSYLDPGNIRRRVTSSTSDVDNVLR